MGEEFSKIALGLLLIAVCVLLGGLFFSLLWNFVVPGLFGLPAINTFQAIALVLVARAIFGSDVTVQRK